MSDVVKYGTDLHVTDEMLSRPTAASDLLNLVGSSLALAFTPEELLTGEQRAQRQENRRKTDELKAAMLVASRELLASLTVYADTLDPGAAAAIRHHLPEPSNVIDILGWTCPGCDGGYDEGGYFPCSTIHAVQEARGVEIPDALR